ncbi:MAG TPA: ScyD/ScyE family protein [Micromonosporaceae bacterium]
MVVMQPLSASAGQTIAKPAALRTTVEVVADGLDTPRGVIYDPYLQRVLVAEAGDAAGNNGTCGTGADGVVYCLGSTGSIYQYTEYAPGTRIKTGLPSIRNSRGTAVLGLHDLSLSAGGLNMVFGLSGDQPFRDSLGPDAALLGTTARLNWNGSITSLGDLAAFEEANNPETYVIDSDPYGIATDGSGTVVADAAGNDVLTVAADGTVSLVSIIANRGYIESVPTAVVKAPGGGYYVGELTGYPFPVGEARIMHVQAGQEPTVVAAGFTNIIDVTVDGEGRLIVLELAKNGLMSGDKTGRLVRIEADGTQTVLVGEGLMSPGGVAYAGSVGTKDTFYVTTGTQGTGNTGQLVKVTTKL